MANSKQRYVNTKFWNDSYITVLDPIEKLLFVYLITNEHTNISGIYELPFKIMAVETGIDESMFKKILPRLKDKIRYLEGYVIIKNFIKHQETKSINVKTGILNCLKDLDINFLKSIVNKGYYTLPKYYCDTLYIPYIETRNYLDSNLDSNLDLDLDSIASKLASPTLEKKILVKDEPFSFKREIKKLEDSPRRELNIIALYFDYRKPDLKTYEQYSIALRRHTKPAKNLVPFTDEQILKAIEYAKKEYKDIYTLETLVKILTK